MARVSDARRGPFPSTRRKEQQNNVIRSCTDGRCNGAKTGPRRTGSAGWQRCERSEDHEGRTPRDSIGTPTSCDRGGITTGAALDIERRTASTRIPPIVKRATPSHRAASSRRSRTRQSLHLKKGKIRQIRPPKKMTQVTRYKKEKYSNYPTKKKERDTVPSRATGTLKIRVL